MSLKKEISLKVETPNLHEFSKKGFASLLSPLKIAGSLLKLSAVHETGVLGHQHRWSPVIQDFLSRGPDQKTLEGPRGSNFTIQ
jgi:hypothetical protein